MCGSYSADTPPHIRTQRGCSTWDKNVEYLDRTIWPNVATWDYKITPPDNWIGILALDKFSILLTQDNSVWFPGILQYTFQYTFLGQSVYFPGILQYTFLGQSVHFPGILQYTSGTISILTHGIIQYTLLGQSVYFLGTISTQDNLLGSNKSVCKHNVTQCNTE